MNARSTPAADWRCPSCAQPQAVASPITPVALECARCHASYPIVDGIACFAPGPHSREMQADLEEMEQFVRRLTAETAGLAPDHPARFRLPHRHVRSEIAQEEVEIPWLETALGSVAGRRILNVSCGLGRDADILVRRLGATHLTLCDISLPSARYARAWILRAYPHVEVEAVQCSAAALPWPDRSFDLVFVWASAHHYPEVAPFLREATRVADQVVLAAEPAPLSGLGWLIRLTGFNAEYAGLPTARLAPSGLVRSFDALGFDTVTRRSMFYVHPIFDRIAGVPGVIATYASVLKLASSITPPCWRHGVTVIARRCPSRT